MSLTFEVETHTYRFNGVVVPSVTQVLKPLTDYGMIPADTLEIARMKGLATHKMVELHSKGDLDEDSLPKWMSPGLAQWRKFLDDTGFEMIVAEQRVYHEQYAFAGTLDFFGRINGDDVFIDVKRSFLSGAIGFQLSAYQEAYVAQQKAGKDAKRYALKLNELGPYRLEEFKDKKDFSRFLVCLAFFKLQREFVK